MKNKIFSLLLLSPLTLGALYGQTGSKTIANVNALSINEDKIAYEIEDYLDEPINTFMAWIKLPTNLNFVPGGVIMGNYHYNKLFPGSCDFTVDENGHFKVFWNGNSYNHSFENFDLRNDKWTHIAFVNDQVNSEVRYYVNGVLSETVNVLLGDSVAHNKYRIGMDQASWFTDLYNRLESPFMGNIKQVSLFSDALSEEQIIDYRYKTELTKSDDESIVANYNFSSWGSSDFVEDTSGQHNAKKVTFNKAVPMKDTGEFDYSFVVVPDIQAMTYWKPANLLKQSMWLVENKDKLNIQFAMYLGDLVEDKYSVNPNTNEAQWDFVSEYLSLLDDEVPYTFILGNHDYDNWAQTSRATTQFNKYMPYDKYSNFSYFGGAYEEGKMDNTYSLFDINGVSYLVFALEEGPRTAILNWVDRVIDIYPESRVLITTHAYLSPQGLMHDKSLPGSAPSKTITYDDANDGQQMWDKCFSKHSNIMAIFAGHECSDDIIYRCDEGKYGNKVYSFLADTQGSIGTIAMNTVMLVKVNEANKTWDISYYWIDEDACFNSQNQFQLSFADEFNPNVGV